MIDIRTSARTAVSAALVPSTAVVLSWAAIDGDGLWSVVVLGWIVALWILAVRSARSTPRVERC